MASKIPLLAMASVMSGFAAAASLTDIDHVVLFMQENRAFDHYFGTMAGVKGFSDPNVVVNSGKPVWEQKYSPSSGKDGYLMPWYINYLGGEWNEATQCMLSASNAWDANHAALNGDKNDQWAAENKPVSWGHYEAKDIPVQWAIADGWTIGDMYMEGAIAPTCPNRVSWVSGTMTSPENLYTDNNMSPGCTRPGINCYPIEWETAAELWQNAGVDWQVFQDTDNFDDNALAYFKQFQEAEDDSELAKRGIAFVGLQEFYDRARAGTLPAISYIVGPMELSEHPPYSPHDGGWLQKQVVEAVTDSPKYNQTALFISYDETGGWGDHVVPYHSPEGTAQEWFEDPYLRDGTTTYVGPGFRLPFYIVSPYTRGGAVFTEPSDHTSQLLFVEKWLAAKGTPITTSRIPDWRREHMSDLTSAFDFANPDFSIPNLPNANKPSQNAEEEWNGSVVCESNHADTTPPIPVKDASLGDAAAIQSAAALLSAKGEKPVRGRLNEGRYLAFDSAGSALANTDGPSVAAQTSAEGHADDAQLWVLWQPDAGLDTFALQSAKDGRWLAGDLRLVEDRADAGTVEVKYQGAGVYALSLEGEGIKLDGEKVVLGEGSEFGVWSVTGF